MRKFANAGALLVLVAALGGCAVDGVAIDNGEDSDAEAEAVYSLIASNDPNLSLCRWISGRLSGQRAIFFRLRANENYVAVSVAGEVVCVDEPSVILRAGVIPIDDANEPACSYCDGTPLPAHEVIELAQRSTDQRTDL